MNDIFNFFSPLSFVKSGTVAYNPLINYDWSTTTAQEYKTDGVKLVINGGFDTDSDWTKGTGWTIVNGVAIRTGATSNSFVGQTITLTAGTTYKFTLDVNSIVGSGTIYTTSTGQTILTFSTIGTKTAYFTPNATMPYIIGYYGTGTAELEIDNISIQKVIEEPNKRYLKDVGSTPTYNASMYFGRGAYLNGVDQYIPMANIDTSLIKTILFTSNGSNIRPFGRESDYSTLLELSLNSTQLRLSGKSILFNYRRTSNIFTSILFSINTGSVDLYINGVFKETQNYTGVINNNFPIQTIGKINVGHCDGTLKDMFMFNRALTQSEITQSYEQPETFYAMAQADSACVLNMPMCETSSTARNYKTGTDYAITNYTSSVRYNAKNLPYGLQTCKFVRDSLGVIQTASDYLECDGTGYAIIPSHADTVNIKMTVNPTSLSGNLLSGGVTKTLTGLTLNIDNDVVISNVTPTGAITLASGFSGTIKTYTEELS